MPIFPSKKLIFIHIPKTGGTSIEKCLVKNGFEMNLYTYKGSIFINDHTPQHCSLCELIDLNLITKESVIFSVVRDPIARVISAFSYIKTYRPDINKKFNDFDEFLNLFLNYENLKLFDNHNLSQFDYLKNQDGIIPSRIKIFQFFDSKNIENFLGINELENFHSFKSDKFHLNITRKHKKLIKSFYANDYKYLKQYF